LGVLAGDVTVFLKLKRPPAFAHVRQCLPRLAHEVFEPWFIHIDMNNRSGSNSAGRDRRKPANSSRFTSL
jgi:hypothetical protein